MSKMLSLNKDETTLLFKAFMPRRKEIKDVDLTKVFDVRIYPYDYFEKFDPSKEFRKLAMIEVTELGSIPRDMVSFTIPSGEYAVFTAKNTSKDNAIFDYIFGEWFPHSAYQIDNRPHFDILSTSSNSELDQIWIPICHKGPT